jgi:hypothetical protein
MIARRIVLAGSVFAFATGAAVAQTTGDSPLQAGDRIRFKTPASSSAMKGTLVAVDDAALTLAPEGRGTAHKTFARSEIANLEVARGKKRNVLWGALGGAAVGLAVDLVATAADDADNDPCDYGACVVLPAMGAAVGALVGLAIKTDRWEAVPSEKLGLAVLPNRHGVRLSLSLRF